MTKSIPLSKGRFALVDDDDYERLAKWTWHSAASYGHAVRRKVVSELAPGEKKGAVWMHREVMNTPDGMITDHINGNPLDNRKENLRICTSLQNSRNARVRIDSISGYKGVSFRKDHQVWRARIQVDGKLIHLGHFRTPEDAARAYDEAAKEYFGEFAVLNFKER